MPFEPEVDPLQGIRPASQRNPLRLDECQQIGVDLLSVRCWHAMREAVINLERAVLQQLG